MTTYPAAMLPVADAMPVPPTTPTVCAIARMPPTLPRPPTGTWSGTVAVTAASIALSEAWTPHQPSAITTTLSATREQHRSDSAPPSAPPTTQGSRRPARSVVRSEKAPKTGLQTTDVAARRGRATSDEDLLLAVGVDRLGLLGEQHWIGPKKPAQSPMLASVRNATQRAGRARGRLGQARERRAGVSVVTAALWCQVSTLAGGFRRRLGARSRARCNAAAPADALHVRHHRSREAVRHAAHTDHGRTRTRTLLPALGALVLDGAGAAAFASPASAEDPPCLQRHGRPRIVVPAGTTTPVEGTAGNDVIYVNGTATVNALGGNDIVCGAPGATATTGGEWDGGEGDDTMTTTSAALVGGAGNDTLTATYSSISGGAGNDVLRGGAGDNTLERRRGRRQADRRRRRRRRSTAVPATTSSSPAAATRSGSAAPRRPRSTRRLARSTGPTVPTPTPVPRRSGRPATPTRSSSAATAPTSSSATVATTGSTARAATTSSPWSTRGWCDARSGQRRHRGLVRRQDPRPAPATTPSAR